MKVGVVKETKEHEYRVSMIPAGVHEIVQHGAQVLVQKNVALSIGITDEDYIKAGATIVQTGKEIFEQADLILKVKEPSDEECQWLTDKQVLFTYLHLAAFPKKTNLLLASGTTAIAYETVTDKQGRLPLLTPMSEVAGRVSIQAGASSLQIFNKGRGTLLGGVSGVLPGKVAVLGAGVVGYNAAKMAIGLGADVTMIDISMDKLYEMDKIFGSRVKTLYSNKHNIEATISQADLVIGGVLIPGAKAPKLITEDMLSLMMPGSVLVDVAIDQGGCFETSKPTSHSNPIYVLDGVVHYCVTNMPGCVARTSTFALCNATLPYVVRLVKESWKSVFAKDEYFAQGLNIHNGKIMLKALEDSLKDN